MRDTNQDTMEECLPFRRLAAAILEQAVWDYRSVVAQGGLKAFKARAAGQGKNSKRVQSYHEAEQTVRFFEGAAFRNLCLFVGVSEDSIRDKLREEGSVE